MKGLAIPSETKEAQRLGKAIMANEPLTRSMSVGKWTINMETKRMKVRTEKNVHCSDNTTGFGKGTLLRTEKKAFGLIVHKLDLKHESGDSYTLQVTVMGKKVSVTKLHHEKAFASNYEDVITPKKESYTLAKAEAFLGRILPTMPAAVLKTLLEPMEEEEDVEALEEVTA